MPFPCPELRSWLTGDDRAVGGSSGGQLDGRWTNDKRQWGKGREIALGSYTVEIDKLRQNPYVLELLSHEERMR